MTLQDPNAESGRGSNAAQLKNDIDSGRTGDKVAGFDPGASPLGTDDEAGGAPHDPHLMAATRAQERAGRPADADPNAATPELQPDARMGRKAYLVPALLGAGLGVGLAALLLLLL